jgi:uncharacterized membrane protein YeaQ/YmgE (transglycosylase-associated protein family)
MHWLVFALMTVCSWGLYGIFLHSGQLGMADPVNGRYKAFLFVGFAYFLTAVLAPLAMLLVSGSDWNFPAKGATLSLVAGTVGAIGAFCVLLAFGAKGTPAAVMSIIFAGAPIVNAVVAMALHPPAGGLGAVRWQFVAGSGHGQGSASANRQAQRRFALERFSRIAGERRCIFRPHPGTRLSQVRLGARRRGRARIAAGLLVAADQDL